MKDFCCLFSVAKSCWFVYTNSSSRWSSVHTSK